MMNLIINSVFFISLLISVYAAIDDMKIYPPTDMPEPMRRHALGEAFLQIENQANIGAFKHRN
jgi:hypothetical protein